MFFLKKIFLLIWIKSVKNNSIKGEKTSSCPSGLSMCPFVKQSYPCINVKSPFPRTIWLNSSFEINIFSIFHICWLKWFDHIFYTSVLQCMRHSEAHVIKSDPWSWKQEIKKMYIIHWEEVCYEICEYKKNPSTFPCFPWVRFFKNRHVYVNKATFLAFDRNKFPSNSAKFYYFYSS